MRRTNWLVCAALAAAAFGAAGCGPSGRVKEETIEVKEQKASAQAKALLENYAKGQPLGSEVTGFPALVDAVRQEDPYRADILAKGFADLQKAPKGATAAKAKEVLAKLAPKMTAD